MRYEKADLWLVLGVVVIGGGALMGATAGAFAGARHVPFTDASGLGAGLSAYAGHAAGALFAVALLDASMIGAFAVSLSTAYAVGDMLGLKHSLHRGVKQAKGFYAMYAALIALAAAIVLIPGSPLGLLTEGVQVLAGVLLPSATVFLLLLCNDKEVLGPWVNGKATNVLAGIVIGVLVLLSAILMISVVFGTVSAGQIFAVMGGGAAVAALAGGFLLLRRGRTRQGNSGAGTWRAAAVSCCCAAGASPPATAGTPATTGTPTTAGTGTAGGCRRSPCSLPRRCRLRARSLCRRCGSTSARRSPWSSSG
jgi:hypothetical protein